MHVEHYQSDQYVLPSHFDWIDGLRGVAAVAVVVFHYHHFYLADYTDRGNIPSLDSFPWHTVFGVFYEYGSAAVQLFWVISGFVFAHDYVDRGAKFRNFVVARFARLYPLHFATLIIVAGLQLVSMAWVGHWQIYGNNDLRHFGLQLVMSSNWTTLSRGLSFNGPIWSVSLEFVAYGLFLITLPLLRFFGLIAALLLAAILWWVGLSETLDIPGISLGAFICAGYFFLGSCVYFVLRQAGARQGVLLALIGIANLVGGWSFWNGIEHLMEASASVAVVGVVALADVMWRGPTIRWLKRLGDMSYSIYLIHVPLQMVILLLDDVMFAGNRDFATSPLTLPLYLFVTIWLADSIYRQFEVPASRALRKKLLG